MKFKEGETVTVILAGKTVLADVLGQLRGATREASYVLLVLEDAPPFERGERIVRRASELRLAFEAPNGGQDDPPEGTR